MKKNRLSPRNLFLVAIVVACILFTLDSNVSNNVLTDNISRIYSALAFGLVGLLLFIIGARQSLKTKSSSWAALNILAIAIIIGWTILSCMALWIFNDFPLVLPP
jgi:hypothetical protein